MTPFRVIIAGSRGFDNYEMLKSKCNLFLKNKMDITILSGTARGADLLGEKYAEEMGFQIERHPADWDRYPRSAGYVRNAEMAMAADALIAFLDGKSRGTQNMIQKATGCGLQVRVVPY